MVASAVGATPVMCSKTQGMRPGHRREHKRQQGRVQARLNDLSTRSSAGNDGDPDVAWKVELSEVPSVPEPLRTKRTVR
jgi:hypothetical protein